MHALLDRLRRRRGEHRAVFVTFAAALARLAAAQGRWSPVEGAAARRVGDAGATVFGGAGAMPFAERPRRLGEARVRRLGEAG